MASSNTASEGKPHHPPSHRMHQHQGGGIRSYIKCPTVHFDPQGWTRINASIIGSSAGQQQHIGQAATPENKLESLTLDTGFWQCYRSWLDPICHRVAVDEAYHFSLSLVPLLSRLVIHRRQQAKADISNVLRGKPHPRCHYTAPTSHIYKSISISTDAPTPLQGPLQQQDEHPTAHLCTCCPQPLTRNEKRGCRGSIGSIISICAFLCYFFTFFYRVSLVGNKDVHILWGLHLIMCETVYLNPSTSLCFGSRAALNVVDCLLNSGPTRDRSSSIWCTDMQKYSWFLWRSSRSSANR